MGNIIEKISIIQNSITENNRKGMDALLKSTEYSEILTDYCADINNHSGSARSEADVSFIVDHTLLNISRFILEPYGFEGYKPFKERKVKFPDPAGTKIHPIESPLKKKERGRIDSKINTVIIEYKYRDNYNTKNAVDNAAKQAISYLDALNLEDCGNYLAFVTDGIRCQFITYSNNIAQIEAIQEFNIQALDRLIRSVMELSLVALNSDNLIKDLVEKKFRFDSPVNTLTKSLYKSLNSMTKTTEADFSVWKSNFGLSHEDISQQKAIEDRRDDLAEIIGQNKDQIKAGEEYRILFALQTSIAIIAILLAYKIVSTIKHDKLEFSLLGIADLGSEGARKELDNITNGRTSHKIGIYNLLAIDCFAWPFRTEQWSYDIYQSINEIVKILHKYEDKPTLTEKIDDLFKDLYMAIMPDSVRHSLGEYYTPMWLAQNVTDSAIDHLPLNNDSHIRFLDPTGGSGTFILDIIHRKKQQYADIDPSSALRFILNEVCMLDANELAVILARINYFIAISDLISDDNNFHIPVFSADSTVSSSQKMSEDGGSYVITIPSENGDVILNFPVEFLEDHDQFASVIQDVEEYLEYDAEDKIKEKFSQLSYESSISERTEEAINQLTKGFKSLSTQGLITSSVINNIINYLFPVSLGKFDLIIGNPPWVDWKSLPSVFRKNIIAACISRNLFSGDGRTGGISLNICALITNVAAENWLKKDGVLAFLMPQSILFQQSYEGFRNLTLSNGEKLFFQEIIDWSKSGHPFYPVQQLFCTFIVSRKKQDYLSGIKGEIIKLNRGFNLQNVSQHINPQTFKTYFDSDEILIKQTNSLKTAFAYANNHEEAEKFSKIAGKCNYTGREGVEFYPQEVQLLKLLSADPEGKTVKVENYQNSKSKFHVKHRTDVVIETTYLRPLIKGVDIRRFGLEDPKYIVAFPYDKQNVRTPIPPIEIREKSRLLYEYFKENKPYLDEQNQYSNKLINDETAAFYAVARTGVYCHAPHYVIFRDNTKWVSTVVGQINTSWGGLKSPSFQNHCVSICQDSEGNFITEMEAHYICAILNSHLVEDFILASSDKRTFKIRLPIRIPKFDETNKIHRKIALLSIEAHRNWKDETMVEGIRNKIDELYLKVLE